jgi:RNA polymerase sigma factor (sigma-70 family)
MGLFRKWGVAAFALTPGWLALNAFRPLRLASRSDRALVAAVRAGDGAAAEQLVERYWDDVAALATGILGDQASGEDVAQETMITLVRRLGSFDNRREFRPWLHRVAVNQAKDALRERARSQTVELVEEPFDPRPPRSEVDPALAKALQKLSASDRV